MASPLRVLKQAEIMVPCLQLPWIPVIPDRYQGYEVKSSQKCHAD